MFSHAVERFDFAAGTPVRVLDRRSRVVVERFRDELGDWRVCVMTPFGSRVHAPWALAMPATNARALPAIQLRIRFRSIDFAFRFASNLLLQVFVLSAISHFSLLC